MNLKMNPKMPLRRTCLRIVFLALFVWFDGQGLAQGLAAEVELDPRGRRVLCLGDSITAAGQYVALVDAWWTLSGQATAITINAGLSSETVSGLSEPGHADGKFPRPDLADRLERVLELARPEIVLACYGMNCGIYQPLDEARFARYQAGQQKLKAAVERRGGRYVAVTPPIYDDARRPLEFSYATVLDRYAEWLVAQRAAGWSVIDLHTPMGSELKRRQRTDAAFTFQPDGVHPDDAGHWQMARVIIAALGEPRALEWESPDAMLAAFGAPAELLPLVTERMAVLRDAYVAAAGHRRPGVAAGMPIDEALRRSAELTGRIERLLPQ